MNGGSEPTGKPAFTLVDLLVIVAVLTILAAILLGVRNQSYRKSSRIGCVNNVKQAALAFRIWSGDNNDSFPMAVSSGQGGTREWVPDGNAFRHFQVMSNELNTPRILVCPNDNRKSATSFETLSIQNVSYFVGLDARITRPQMFLLGDRNVSTSASPENSVLALKQGSNVSWTPEIHGRQGHIGFVDGSVQTLTIGGLRNALKNTDDLTNRIALPE